MQSPQYREESVRKRPGISLPQLFDLARDDFLRQDPALGTAPQGLTDFVRQITTRGLTQGLQAIQDETQPVICPWLAFEGDNWRRNVHEGPMVKLLIQ